MEDETAAKDVGDDAAKPSPARARDGWRDRVAYQFGRASTAISAAVLISVLISSAIVTRSGRSHVAKTRDAQLSNDAGPAGGIAVIPVKVRPLVKSKEAEKPPEPAKPPAPAPSPAVTAPVLPEPTWSDVEVMAALRHCVETLPATEAEATALAPIRSGQCGLPAPISLKHLGHDRVEVRPPVTVNCAVASALHTWLETVVQPAARETLGSPVVAFAGASAYACRNRNGAETGPISEHAFGNAIDISSFVLADGRSIDVLGGWGMPIRDRKAIMTAAPGAAAVAAKPSAPGSSKSAASGEARSGVGLAAVVPPAVAPTPDAATLPAGVFLRRIHHSACGIFGTVLGPEANDEHRNHLHLDAKARAHKAVCE